MYEEISTNKSQSHQQYDNVTDVYGDSFRDLHSQTLLEINHQPETIKQSAVKESLKGAKHDLECHFDIDHSDGTSVDQANAQKDKQIEQLAVAERLPGAKDEIELDNDYSERFSVDLANVQEENGDTSSVESDDDAEDDMDDVKTSQEEIEMSQTEDEVYPQLSIDNVLDKLDDMDEDCVVLEDIQSIGSDNLGKLQTLNRSSQVIKRLLANNRLTSRDVKTTTIDSDIKSSVSEFLKTNVVGNFIISRVLRENFSTFFGWLTTHLQCERNSWLVRLKQILHHFEELRRDNSRNHDAIIESAQKVEVLLQLCRQTLQSSSNQDYEMNIPKLSPLPPLSSLSYDSYLTPDNNPVGSNVKSQLKPNTKPKIASSLATVKNVKNDSSEECATGLVGKNGLRNCAKSSRTELVHSNLNSQLKSTKTYKFSTEETSSQIDSATDSDNTRKRSVEDIDVCKDWKESLRNSFQQLQESCECLVLDRKDCLKHLGANPSVSLTEAVVTFVKKRKTSGQCKRKEIEHRLSLLEAENQELIQEMATLQNLLSNKQKDALNLQKQLDKLEKLLSNATCDKHDKCVGTDDTEQRVVSNGSNKHRIPHSDSVSQTPYRYKMMSNSNAIQKGTKEKETNISSNRPIEQERRELQANHDKFKLTHNTDEKHNNINSVERQTYNGHAIVKEKSLIEISEEKLKILKQRAQKLEHSLHDAISSMTLLHKNKEDDDSSLDQQPATRPGQSKPSMKSLANRLQVKGSSPRLAVIRRPMSQGRSQSETLLVSEPTSFLTGRSVALTSHNPTDRSLAQSVLTVMADKHKSDIQTKRDYEQYINNREPGNFSNYINKELGTGKAVKVKVISRHRSTSNGMVSKCLRCQKLFCAVDNHKMACFYHTKDKERIEHYDQTGKLLRVAQVWMCCHQPQEIEGCCYGRHI